MLTNMEATTLARGWPWPMEEVESASRVAEAANWSVSQLVGFLDALALFYGSAATPELNVRAAVGMGVRRYQNV